MAQDLDDLMKRLGAPKNLHQGGDAPKPAPTPAPAEPAPGPSDPAESPGAAFMRGFSAPRPAAPPSGDPSESSSGGATWGQTLDPTPIAKGAVGEAADVAGLIPGVSKLPFVQSMKQWSAPTPDEQYGTFKRFAGSMAPWMLMPELGIERGLAGLAGKAIGKVAPRIRVTPQNVGTLVTKAGKRPALGTMVNNPAYKSAASAPPSTLQKLAGSGAARFGARAVQGAVPGAVAGAAASPEDRIGGALWGGAAGSLVPNLSTLARGAAPFAGAGAGYHFFGLPGLMLGPLMHVGPGGHLVHGIFDQTGRLIGALPPSVIRALSGLAGGTMAGQGPPGSAPQSPSAWGAAQEERAINEEAQVRENSPVQAQAQPRSRPGRPAGDSDSETEDEQSGENGS